MNESTDAQSARNTATSSLDHRLGQGALKNGQD